MPLLANVYIKGEWCMKEMHPELGTYAETFEFHIDYGSIAEHLWQSLTLSIGLTGFAVTQKLCVKSH